MRGPPHEPQFKRRINHRDALCQPRLTLGERDLAHRRPAAGEDLGDSGRALLHVLDGTGEGRRGLAEDLDTLLARDAGGPRGTDA